MIQIGVSGAAGKMGRRILALALADEGLRVNAALEAEGHEAIGQDVGHLAGTADIGIRVASQLTSKVDVLLDFSSPSGAMARLSECRKLAVPLIVGTTGLSEEQTQAVESASQVIPCLIAANMSTGVNLLARLVADAAKSLGEGYDVEITEAHHRMKKDAPSGTAVAIAESICKATGKKYDEAAVFGRSGSRPRRSGEIGMHSLRAGDTIGEHTVYFGNLGETVTLGHSAHTRDTFVRGALRAAGWICGRKPGLYGMGDVLGI